MVESVRQGVANDEQMKKIAVVSDDVMEIFIAHDLDISMKFSCTVSALAMLVSTIAPHLRESAIATVVKTLRTNIEWLDKLDASGD